MKKEAMTTSSSPARMSSATSIHNTRELISYVLSFPRSFFGREHSIIIYSTSIAIFTAPIIWWFLNKSRKAAWFLGRRTSTRAVDTPLIQEFTTVQTFKTSYYTYPSVRVFYHPHPSAAKLPRELPLIVFVHGLGGQIGQWRYQLEHFTRLAHVLAIDLPGCGGSSMSPYDWSAYTTPALADLVGVIIQAHVQPNQKYIVIGHSMGCSISAKCIAEHAALSGSNKCAGFVAVTPKASISEHEAKRLNVLAGLPFFVFDGLRFIDKRGGINSPSVLRIVSNKASDDVKKLQLEFNSASRTPTTMRFIKGVQLPGEDVWGRISCPCLVIGASEDKLTPPGDVDIIKSYLYLATGFTEEKVVESKIIEGSGHAVLYEKPAELCGVIAKFLSTVVNSDLDAEWQADTLRKSVV